MPRITRRHLVIALLALPLVSCFHDSSDCPTCPGTNSSRIGVFVPQTGLVDSVHVRVDGGSQITVRRNRRHTFENLSSGLHDVTITRWFFIEGLISSRSSSLQIELDEGETRTIVFHNDFPLIAWAPAPGPGRAAGLWVHDPIPHRGAWLRANTPEGLDARAADARAGGSSLHRGLNATNPLVARPRRLALGCSQAEPSA